MNVMIIQRKAVYRADHASLFIGYAAHLALGNIHVVAADTDTIGMLHLIRYHRAGENLSGGRGLDLEHAPLELKRRILLPSLIIADVEVSFLIKFNAHIAGQARLRMHGDVEPLGDVVILVNTDHAAGHIILRIIGTGHNQIPVLINRHAIGRTNIFRQQGKQCRIFHGYPPSVRYHNVLTL